MGRKLGFLPKRQNLRGFESHQEVSERWLRIWVGIVKKLQGILGRPKTGCQKRGVFEFEGFLRDLTECVKVWHYVGVFHEMCHWMGGGRVSKGVKNSEKQVRLVFLRHRDSGKTGNCVGRIFEGRLRCCKNGDSELWGLDEVNVLKSLKNRQLCRYDFVKSGENCVLWFFMVLMNLVTFQEIGFCDISERWLRI